MILKKRSKPPEIFQLESLIQRTPGHHPHLPHWTEKLRRITAGFHGEQRIDSQWHEIQLNFPHFFIHDLFIQKLNSTHQLDTVLVTSRFVLILEIKSISGLLNFDSQLHQFFRTNKDGSIDGMRNPDDQVRRHEKWMAHFLSQQRVDLPVVGAIVFTYPSSVIQSRPGKRIMIQSSGLPYLMEQLLVRYPENVLSSKRTQTLARKLAALHTDKPLALPELPAGFLKGVLCVGCVEQKMSYRQGKWRCKQCGQFDTHAHLNALAQYRVLVSPRITSSEFRDFMGIASTSVASKMLTNLNMSYTGTFKDRNYLIPEAFSRSDSILAESDSIWSKSDSILVKSDSICNKSDSKLF